MSEKVIVDVGAQHLGRAVRLAVTDAGVDDEGVFAVLAVGSHPDAIDVRLRTGTPQALPSGPVLTLAGFNPAGRRGSVALEISDPR